MAQGLDQVLPYALGTGFYTLVLGLYVVSGFLAILGSLTSNASIAIAGVSFQALRILLVVSADAHCSSWLRADAEFWTGEILGMVLGLALVWAIHSNHYLRHLLRYLIQLAIAGIAVVTVYGAYMRFELVC